MSKYTTLPRYYVCYIDVTIHAIIIYKGGAISRAGRTLATILLLLILVNVANLFLEFWKVQKMTF